jgi:hypothetical protein
VDIQPPQPVSREKGGGLVGRLSRRQSPAAGDCRPRPRSAKLEDSTAASNLPVDMIATCSVATATPVKERSDRLPIPNLSDCSHPKSHGKPGWRHRATRRPEAWEISLPSLETCVKAEVTVWPPSSNGDRPLSPFGRLGDCSSAMSGRLSAPRNLVVGDVQLRKRRLQP